MSNPIWRRLKKSQWRHQRIEKKAQILSHLLWEYFQVRTNRKLEWTLLSKSQFQLNLLSLLPWGFVVFFEQMALHLRIDRRSGSGGFHDFEGFSSLNFWPKSKNNHNFFFTAVVFCLWADVEKLVNVWQRRTFDSLRLESKMSCEWNLLWSFFLLFLHLAFLEF